MQKSEARKSREADIVCVLENLNVIGSSHLERGESDLDDLMSRPDSQSCGNSVELRTLRKVQL